ncbi:MAG TPA: AEC family transporter, partial [Bacillota bacterium]|nr:AEC family transporter [Bacillota bacterium]
SLGVKGLFSGMEVWIGSLMRLLVLPTIFIILMKILRQDNFPVKVANLLVAMPAAAQTVIFAERHDADVLLASKIVFISTVLSAITIPIVAQLL